jgi:hypothetical protein
MREVLDGHGEGGVPDHRIDIEGELVNAEYHAELIDETFMRKLRMWRRELQNRRFTPKEEDLGTIDVFYYVTDSFDGYEVDELIFGLYSNLEESETTSNITSNLPTKGCGCNKK